jgi:alpha-beta hydrolase superfamily lysophospholipase
MTRADELTFATTRDGWRVALHRFRPRGPRRRHPVICCHGLGANHLVFDVHAEVSLAAHLASRGYEVFALELRGHGKSDRPDRRSPRRFGWSFDDYLLADVPAALSHACELAGAAATHWIGHSMGGLLLYAHLARGDAGAIRSGIAVGSSLDYSASPSGFHRMLPLAAVLSRVPAVPVGLVARLSAPLVGRWPSPFERFNVWSTNVEPALWQAVCQRGFHAVSAPVMLQLASAMRPGGLTSADGATAYVRGLAGATTPVLGLAGDRDAQAPPDAARGTIEALGSPRKELLVFGRDHGHEDHYGHFDLLIGRRAHREVFPHIDAWLDEHD